VRLIDHWPFSGGEGAMGTDCICQKCSNIRLFSSGLLTVGHAAREEHAGEGRRVKCPRVVHPELAGATRVAVRQGQQPAVVLFWRILARALPMALSQMIRALPALSRAVVPALWVMRALVAVLWCVAGAGAGHEDRLAAEGVATKGQVFYGSVEQVHLDQRLRLPLRTARHLEYQQKVIRPCG
jgi:hypothetical protein